MSCAAGDCRDLFGRLPDECIAHVFRFITDNNDRSSCGAVSKKWLNLLARMSSFGFHHQQRAEPEEDEDVSVTLDYDRATDTKLAVALIFRNPTELTIRASRWIPTATTNGVTDVGLKLIAQACPKLRYLVLLNCPHATDAGLAMVAKGCRFLQNLYLDNVRSVGSDDGFPAIAAYCKSLTTLTLDSCPLFGDQAMTALAKHASQLAYINVMGCPRVGDNGIIALASLLGLVDWKLEKMRIGDAALQAIGESAARSVRLIKVIGPSEAGYSWVAARGEIESLTLRSCSGLGSASFEPRTEKSFSGLKRVSIINCSSLTDECLLGLTKQAFSLESLTLKICSGGLTCGGLVRAIANCSKTLTMLLLVACHFNNGEVNISAACPQLSTLKVLRCVGMTDRFFQWLGVGNACRQVEHVAVGEMGDFITNQIILELFKTHEGCIERLELVKCVAVDDRSMLVVAEMFKTKLRFLKLEGCSGLSDRFFGEIGRMCPKLRELNLSQCEISNKGLKSLLNTELTELEVLSLAGCHRITDRGLENLESGCSNLDVLNLKDTRVSTRRMEAIKEEIKDVLFLDDLIG